MPQPAPQPHRPRREPARKLRVYTGESFEVGRYGREQLAQGFISAEVP
jgi:hypothetical protein